MGGEGAVTASLTFNWPNFSPAPRCRPGGLWFIGSVFCSQFRQISLGFFNPLPLLPQGAPKENPLLLRVAAGWRDSDIQRFGLSRELWAKRG